MKASDLLRPSGWLSERAQPNKYQQRRQIVFVDTRQHELSARVTRARQTDEASGRDHYGIPKWRCQQLPRRLRGRTHLLGYSTRKVRPLSLYLFLLKYSILSKLYCIIFSKSGINETFEGHYGPVTGLSCHQVQGPIDFSHIFLTSSFDWTVKLWNLKVISKNRVYWLRRYVCDRHQL